MTTTEDTLIKLRYQLLKCTLVKCISKIYITLSKNTKLIYIHYSIISYILHFYDNNIIINLNPLVYIVYVYNIIVVYKSEFSKYL